MRPSCSLLALPSQSQLPPRSVLAASAGPGPMTPTQGFPGQQADRIMRSLTSGEPENVNHLVERLFPGPQALRTLVLIRGLPGSGKTHLATQIRRHVEALAPSILTFITEAEDHFPKDDEENGVADGVVPKTFMQKRGLAHARCRDFVSSLWHCSQPTRQMLVIVTNLFTAAWEQTAYLRLIEEGPRDRAIVIDLYDSDGLEDISLIVRASKVKSLTVLATLRQRWYFADPPGRDYLVYLKGSSFEGLSDHEKSNGSNGNGNGRLPRTPVPNPEPSFGFSVFAPSPASASPTSPSV